MSQQSSPSAPLVLVYLRREPSTAIVASSAGSWPGLPPRVPVQVPVALLERLEQAQRAYDDVQRELGELLRLAELADSGEHRYSRLLQEAKADPLAVAVLAAGGSVLTLVRDDE